MSAESVSLPTNFTGKIQYGDALCIKDTVPGVGVAVATQTWQSARDGRGLTVKFMTRVETGEYAGLCYSLDTPGTVQLSDVDAVHEVGDDGDRALVAFDKLGYRMVDGVYYVRKEEEQRNAAMAYPISLEEYDLEYVQHCRRHNRNRNRKRKRCAHGDENAADAGAGAGAGADAKSDDSASPSASDSDSAYDSAVADDIYGDCDDDDSSDSDYNGHGADGSTSGDDDSDDSLDGFIVHSDEEDNFDNGHNDDGNSKNKDDTGFTHPDATCDNADVKAMQEAASQYRKWTPRTAQERAAKSLIDRIEARARHSEDEKRFRRGKAALEVDR